MSTNIKQNEYTLEFLENIYSIDSIKFIAELNDKILRLNYIMLKTVVGQNFEQNDEYKKFIKLLQDTIDECENKVNAFVNRSKELIEQHNKIKDNIISLREDNNEEKKVENIN